MLNMDAFRVLLPMSIFRPIKEHLQLCPQPSSTTSQWSTPEIFHSSSLEVTNAATGAQDLTETRLGMGMVGQADPWMRNHKFIC